MAELEQRAADEEEDSAPVRQIQQPGKPDRGRSRRYKAMKAKVGGPCWAKFLTLAGNAMAHCGSSLESWEAVPALHRSLPRQLIHWSPWRP